MSIDGSKTKRLLKHVMSTMLMLLAGTSINYSFGKGPREIITGILLAFTSLSLAFLINPELQAAAYKIVHSVSSSRAEHLANKSKWVED